MNENRIGTLKFILGFVLCLHTFSAVAGAEIAPACNDLREDLDSLHMNVMQNFSGYVYSPLIRSNESEAYKAEIELAKGCQTDLDYIKSLQRYFAVFRDRSAGPSAGSDELREIHEDFAQCQAKADSRPVAQILSFYFLTLSPEFPGFFHFWRPFMFSQLYFGSKTIAYASLSLGEKDFDAIGDYCLNQSFEVDTFAEETGSLESNRPVLNQVFELVEQKKVNVLVIPSIDHILCSPGQKENLASGDRK